jgi:hypothetical protein
VRPISWLHVSDIHMSVRDAWSQDVVLRAMCDRIEYLRKQGSCASRGRAPLLITNNLSTRCWLRPTISPHCLNVKKVTANSRMDILIVRRGHQPRTGRRQL